MSGLNIPQNYADMMRDMEKRVSRLERHRHPNILDPVSENQIGAVGIHHCPTTGETTVVGVGSNGVLTGVLSCGCGGVPDHEH